MVSGIFFKSLCLKCGENPSLLLVNLKAGSNVKLVVQISNVKKKKLRILLRRLRQENGLDG